MVEGVEHLETELELPRTIPAQREVLEDRDVVVVETRVRQVIPRAEPVAADVRQPQYGRVEPLRAGLRSSPVARELHARRVVGRTRDAATGRRLDAGGADLRGRAAGELTDPGKLPVVEDLPGQHVVAKLRAEPRQVPDVVDGQDLPPVEARPPVLAAADVGRDRHGVGVSVGRIHRAAEGVGERIRQGRVNLRLTCTCMEW